MCAGPSGVFFLSGRQRCGACVSRTVRCSTKCPSRTEQPIGPPMSVARTRSLSRQDSLAHLACMLLHATRHLARCCCTPAGVSFGVCQTDISLRMTSTAVLAITAGRQRQQPAAIGACVVRRDSVDGGAGRVVPSAVYNARLPCAKQRARVPMRWTGGDGMVSAPCVARASFAHLNGEKTAALPTVGVRVTSDAACHVSRPMPHATCRVGTTLCV